MDFQFPIVIDIAQLEEFVHEVADGGSGRPDHLREDFLTELSDDWLRCVLLAEIRKMKEKASEALFARIEQLVDQVLFNSTIPTQQVSYEQFREFRSSCMVAIIAALAMRLTRHSSIAVAVVTRSGCPLRHPSPKK